MNRTALAAACAAIGGVAAPAPASYFIYQAAVIPDATLTPSSGSFVVQYAQPDQEGAFLDANRIGVLNDRATWKNQLDDVMASTWLAIDAFGPKGADGAAPYGTGWAGQRTGPSGPPVNVPQWNFTVGISNAGMAINGQLGDPVNGDGLSPGFVGGTPGFAWQAPPEASFKAYSGSTLINGTVYDSLFLGHFVLSDPNATLVGEDLLIGMPPDQPDHYPGIFVPLDGSRGVQIISSSPVTTGDEVPFWLEYERTTFSNSLGTFTALDMYLVPAPSAVCVLGVPLLTRRRRRNA